MIQRQRRVLFPKEKTKTQQRLFRRRFQLIWSESIQLVLFARVLDWIYCCQQEESCNRVNQDRWQSNQAMNGSPVPDDQMKLSSSTGRVFHDLREFAPRREDRWESNAVRFPATARRVPEPVCHDLLS